MAPMYQARADAMLDTVAPSWLPQQLLSSLDLAQQSIVLQTPLEVTFQPDAHAMLATAATLQPPQQILSSLDLAQLSPVHPIAMA